MIRITAGNLKHRTIPIAGHYDFFLPDCIGSSRRSANGHSKPIQIHLDGLNTTVETDIGTDAGTGKARRHFRGRSWPRRFFQYHEIKPGDVLTLEKLASRRYRLYPCSARPTTRHPLLPLFNERPRPEEFTAAEFFAGIGLLRLALERQGWRVLFANDICPEKAEMYRHNWASDNHLLVGDIHKIKPDEVPTCDLFTASLHRNCATPSGMNPFRKKGRDLANSLIAEHLHRCLGVNLN